MSDHPSVNFPKERSLRDNLTSSKFSKPLSNPDMPVGTFPCSSYSYCQHQDTRSVLILPDGTVWRRHPYIDCNSKGIVYLLNCPCGAFYVGITRREFHRRIYDHVYEADISYYKSPIGKHIAFVHNNATQHLTFVPLTYIPLNPRGGDWECQLLEAEARWIYRLKVLSPPGLNKSQSFGSFL